MIFLRFHDISNDIRQRGRRSKYAFDYEKLKKGHRSSQMLQLNKVVLPEETKLKAIGQRMHKVRIDLLMSKLKKQRFLK